MSKLLTDMSILIDKLILFYRLKKMWDQMIVQLDENAAMYQAHILKCCTGKDLTEWKEFEKKHIQ